MKKLISYLPAAIMFIILAGLLIFMCLPQNQSHIKAVNGILDVRGKAGSTQVTPLHGEWDFYYGELLTPDTLTSWQTEMIRVPASWTDAGYPLNGYATYHLKILTEEQAPLMLFLPEIPSAYVLWVNGELTRIVGTVSANPAGSQALFNNTLVPVNAENGVVDIILQISNYHFVYGGITDTLLLGESSAVLSWFLRTRAFSCIALGCILMAAFYHLSLYIYRRREKTYLLFSLLCFLCFVRFLVETNGINEYFQWLPMRMFGIRFYLFMFLTHSMAICTFSLYVFNREILIKHKRVLVAYLLTLLLVYLITPVNSTLYLIITTAISLPFSIFVTVMAARSRVLKENKMMRLYFAALVFYMVAGTVSKLFLDNTLFMTGLITNMFMVMSQSLVLSRQYTNAFRFVEETNANLEQIVNERTHSLQATNAAMKELVSNISHDLKTPLAVMSLNLETLSVLSITQSDADYQRHVRTAYQKNRDLQRLIGNLFEVSRIEASRNLYTPEWASLLHILAQVKDKYDTFLEDNGIIFEIIIENDVDISTDSQKIWSVFDNIIYNAARYTENGGSIIINACNNEHSATVTITDTGCGITPEHLPHVFERFYRGSQARSTNEGESGLGLYIVKCIMEGCGGGVMINSDVGRGTSVVLTFPAKITSKNDN